MHMQISKCSEDCADKFTEALVEILGKQGLPARVVVPSEAAYKALEKISCQLNTELVLRMHTPNLDAVKRELIDYFSKNKERMEQFMDMLDDPNCWPITRIKL